MFERIVVGVGKTDSAKSAARVATDLAERYGSTLHFVLAFAKGTGDGGGRKDAEAFLDSLVRGATGEAHAHAIPGDPADTVLMVADEVTADLIVVGNKGMQGARRVLGSVPNSIAHGAKASVLIVDTQG